MIRKLCQPQLRSTFANTYENRLAAYSATAEMKTAHSQIMQSLGRIMLALAAALPLLLSSAYSAQAQQTTQFYVDITDPFTQGSTDTGIKLTKGDTISFSASGVVNWYTGSCDEECVSTPNGLHCSDYPAPAPALPCLSLIGQIGDGAPFEIGDSLQDFVAPNSGELYVGINDNYYDDNTGAWFVTVNQNAKSLGACPCNSSYQGVLPSSAGDPENPGSGTDAGAAPSGYGGGGSWGSGGGGASARMRTNGNAGGAGPRAVTGDFFVDIATGNLFYEVTDYSTAGQNPLTFTRYYNSRASVSGLPTYGLQLVSATALNGPLGASWRSNYERYLQITSTTVTAERLDGQQLTFTLSGGAWTPDSDVDITLSQAGSTWTLTDSNDTVETYTAMGSSAALLSSIQSRNGYTQTLTYNAAHQLTTVTDSYSRSLTLAYNSHGNIEKLTTPDGTTVTYGYTLPLAGGYNLTSVTYSTTPTSTITYSYTNPNQPGQLWGVTDENGSSYISWTYNYYSRVGTSHIGGSAFATSYSYNSDGTTTITGPNGVADTYTFSMLQGVPKITKISRAATTTTKAATETFAFDGNGYLSSSTDWNGNKTAYTNNANGEPLTITEAAGTSVARTTTIAYDSTWIHLPATIATQGLTTSYVYDGSGQVLTRTLKDTTSTTAPYSTSGQKRTWTNTWSNYLLASVMTPNGHTTTLGYDSAGALTSITDALGHVSHITANTAGGLPETIVDPNGVTTTLAYDERQRLTSSQVSGTGGTFTTQYTLASDGTLSKLTLPDGSYLAYTYFQSHDLWKVADALGNLRPFASAARRTVQWVPVGGFCFKVRRNNTAICWSETERGRPGQANRRCRPTDARRSAAATCQPWPWTRPDARRSPGGLRPWRPTIPVGHGHLR